MNQLAVLALGSAALLSHVILVLLAAPLLAVRLGPIAGWWTLAGWRGWVARPFVLLGVQAGREPVRFEGGSVVPRWVPVLSLSFTGCAALLVPSFLRGMLDWPLSDLVLVLGLLTVSRGAWLASAADGGSAASGLAAVGGMVDALLALPGLVLSAAVLVSSSGGAGLDAMLSGQHGLAGPGALACVAAMALAALASGGRDAALSQTLSGPDLVLFRLEGGLRRLVWVDLLGALAWPGSVASAQSGPLQWMLALICWLLRLGLALAIFEIVARRADDTASRRGLAALSLFAALLGPILFLATQGAE